MNEQWETGHETSGQLMPIVSLTFVFQLPFADLEPPMGRYNPLVCFAVGKFKRSKSC